MAPQPLDTLPTLASSESEGVVVSVTPTGEGSMIEVGAPSARAEFHSVRPPDTPPPPPPLGAKKGRGNGRMSSAGGRSHRYSVIHRPDGRGSLVRRCSSQHGESSTELNVVDEVDVPHEIISVLAHNMPRLLQLVAHWADREGEVDPHAFERVMHTLGVRYTPSQLQRLFRVLDADSNGRVSLQELLLLKFAIDNEITKLPPRPNLASDDDDFLDRAEGIGKRGGRRRRPKNINREVVLKIDTLDTVQKKHNDFGFYEAVKPVFGAIWKAELRPHHALALEHSWHAYSRGPPDVHATLRVMKRPAGSRETPRVMLSLLPKRGTPLGERTRFVYQAGAVASVERFCDEAQLTLESAAERATSELGALLSEVRQLDLKLQEVRLIQKGDLQQEHMRERLSRLKLMMTAFADDTEQCLISQTRYSRPEFGEPEELVGCPRVARFMDELVPVEGHRRWRRGVTYLASAGVALTMLFYLSVSRGVTDEWYDNYQTCEFHALACQQYPDTYECYDLLNVSESALRIVEDSVTCGSSVAIRYGDWALRHMNRTCDKKRQEQSGAFATYLPLLFISSVMLPIGLFKNNAHRTTIIKCIVWTPKVPLILLQCLVRAAILLSLIKDAADKPYAEICGVEALMLVPQVGVFLLMDAMRHPAPLLRLFFALFLGLRFLVSMLSRATREHSAEQRPLLEPGPLRDSFMGAGTSSKQSVLTSIDWTIFIMISSVITSVIFNPSEMAVVRLRCDTKGYFTWRDQYIGAMAVRAHRRDLDAADRYLWLQSKTDSLLDEAKAHIARFKRKLRGTWNVREEAVHGEASTLAATAGTLAATTRPAAEESVC